jgi:hypothetical protein
LLSEWWWSKQKDLLSFPCSSIFKSLWAPGMHCQTLVRNFFVFSYKSTEKLRAT